MGILENKKEREGLEVGRRTEEEIGIGKRGKIFKTFKI